MGLVQSRWEDEQCRYEDGLFFPDDTFILLEGNPTNGYLASIRQPLHALIEADPDGWTDIDIDPTGSARHRSLLVLGGGGTYEGDGVLAVTDSVTHRLV